MAIALSFLDDLWRVRIDLTGITPDGAVRIERAFVTPDPPWQVVRGGVELPIVGGVGQLDDYEYADQTLNHYRVFRVDPAPGLALTGTAGDNASTPDDASLDITHQLDIAIDLALDSYEGTGSTRYFITKYDTTTDQRSYAFRLSTDGIVQLLASSNGTGFSTISSGSPVPAINGDRVALRVRLLVDDITGDWEATFFWAPTINDAWVQFGDSPVGTFANPTIFVGTAPLVVGTLADGTAPIGVGTVFAARVTDLEAGTVVANPDFTNLPHGATNFIDDAGKAWTVNGTAEIIGGQVLETDSITPDNQGNTILKSIKYPMLNRAIPAPDYRPIQRAARTGIYNIKGRVPPVAVHDAWTAQYWTIETVTNTLAEARDLDLAVIASGTYFLQVPPEEENECFTNPVSGMPGGYIAIINSTQRHAVGGSHVMGWVFFIRIVAMPPPEIFGTTLTWNTVERLYGSWTALWASNATWRDVWATIGDLEDPVVLS